MTLKEVVKRNMSLKALAGQLGVSPQAVSQYDDKLSLERVREVLDIAGYDLIARDRDTKQMIKLTRE